MQRAAPGPASRTPTPGITSASSSTAQRSRTGDGPRRRPATAAPGCAACVLGSASIVVRQQRPARRMGRAQPSARRRAAPPARRPSRSAASLAERRGRSVVYVKGNEEIATLLRLAGANRAVLDFETARVGREVQSRLEPPPQRRGGQPRPHRARRRAPARRHRRARGLRAPRRPAARTARGGRRRVGGSQTPTSMRSPPASASSRSAANHRLRRLVELAAED